MEFEDYGQAMKRTVSETSLSKSEAKEKPAGKSKGKLWPFIKNKNKVTNEHTHLHSSVQQKPRWPYSILFCKIFFTWKSPCTVGIFLGGGVDIKFVSCYVGSVL